MITLALRKQKTTRTLHMKTFETPSVTFTYHYLLCLLLSYFVVFGATTAIILKKSAVAVTPKSFYLTEAPLEVANPSVCFPWKTNFRTGVYLALVTSPH